jgi:ABC-2 type transport system permease protein
VKVWVIAARELGAAFTSVVGWLIATAFLFISGFVFFLGSMGYAEYSEAVVQQPYVDVQLTYADYLLWPFFSFQALFLTFLIPGITMRLFSEELRQRTLELLLTAPVTTWEIVLGKFLGAQAFVTLLLLGNGWVAIFLLAWTEVDPRVLGCGYLAVWLASACMVALGTAFSAMTAHQVVALVLAECTAFALWLVTAVADQDPTGLLRALALTEHMEDLSRGLIRLSDLTFFLVFVAVCLVATHQRLTVRRWA